MLLHGGRVGFRLADTRGIKSGPPAAGASSPSCLVPSCPRAAVTYIPPGFRVVSSEDRRGGGLTPSHVKPEPSLRHKGEKNKVYSGIPYFCKENKCMYLHSKYLEKSSGSLLTTQHWFPHLCPQIFLKEGYRILLERCYSGQRLLF